MKRTGFFALIITLVLLVILTVPVFASAAPQEGVPVIELTPALLGSLAGVVLSLIFSYIPGLNVKFAALAPEIKRLTMLFVLAAVSLTLYVLNCQGVINTGIACARSGVIQLVTLFLTALVSNQSTYSITPLPESVKLAASGPIEKPLTEHDVQSYG